MSSAATTPQERRPKMGGLAIFRAFVDIWRYRHAMMNFTWTTLRGRYKRSILGFVWSFINPLLFIVTYLIVFKYIMQQRQENYTVMLFCTLLTWRFFNAAVLDGSASVGAKISLIKKVSFPRIILPASSLMANLIDYALALIILSAYYIFVKVTLDWSSFFLALGGLALLIVFAFGMSITLAAISAFYQDVRFLVGSLFQMWFFLSPVLYSVEKVVNSGIHPLLLKAYLINPVTPLMMAVTSILPGNPDEPQMFVPTRFVPNYYEHLAFSAAVAVVILIVGLVVFKRLEPTFAKEV